MTNRSFQETVELVIFGLIALLVGIGVLWVTGWLINLLGSLFMIIASFVWTLLRFILPVVVVAAVIYFIVRYAARGERRPATAGSAHAAPMPPSVPPSTSASTAPAVTGGPAPRATDVEVRDVEVKTVDAEPAPRPVAAESTSDLEEPVRGEPREPEER